MELTKTKIDKHNRLVQQRNLVKNLSEKLEKASDTLDSCQKNFDEADEAVRVANKEMK